MKTSKKINDKYSNTPVNMFQGLVFLCSREVPRYSLEFVILAFGGEVTWDSDPDLINKKITHVITDRDPKFIKFEKKKEYIQPQWVYDSINSKILLPITDYAPGKPLPPHLSPFALKEEAYKPERLTQIEKIKGENADEAEEENNEEQDQEEDEEMEEEFEVEKEIEKVKKQKEKTQKEQVELGKMVMSRKKQKLYDKAMVGRQKEQDKATKLKVKKEKLKKMNKADKAPKN